MNSPVHLCNTLVGKKEPLRAEHPVQVTMYVLGPTGLNFAHVGNARSAVVLDVLARLLRHDYQEVVYACNFTNMNDKIKAAAATDGVPIGTITSRYIDAYSEDMQALGVKRHYLELHANDHICATIERIQGLIHRGHAYVEQAHVLLHVTSYSVYGQLSGQRIEGMLAGARLDGAPHKRDARDLMLWIPSTPELPGWDSPWGWGRPGWHVECSAMIRPHLGHTMDMPGGGKDFIFPQHEHQIVQRTYAHCALYCTWVHNGFIMVNGHKMSESPGNALLVRDLLMQAPGEAIRLALLSTHYRQPLDWSAQGLMAARQALVRFYSCLAKVGHIVALPNVLPDAQFLEELRNDLNVPGALNRLHKLRTELDDSTTDTGRAHAKSRLLVSAGMLGLLQQVPSLAMEALAPLDWAHTVSANLLRKLLAERQRARERRDFARANTLRGEIEKVGFIVEDTLKGMVVRPKRKELE
nr:cysteine--tRNA ligase [Comamonas koreensis]